MSYTPEQANAVLRRALYLQTHPSVRKPVTDAHRAELLRHLQHGALSFRALCALLDESTGRLVQVTPDGSVDVAATNARLRTKRVSTLDRGLVRRTLHSLVDRGEVMAVKVRRPSVQPFKRERRPFLVYAPVPVKVRRVAVDEVALIPDEVWKALEP